MCYKTENGTRPFLRRRPVERYPEDFLNDILIDLRVIASYGTTTDLVSKPVSPEASMTVSVTV